MPQTEYTIVDRHHKPITVGCKIEIRHCVGPYGQTQTDSGTVQSIDSRFRGVTIASARETRLPGRGGIARHIRAGEAMYLCLPGRFTENAQGGSLYVCEYQHQDVEHSHTAWVEVTEEPRD